MRISDWSSDVCSSDLLEGWGDDVPDGKVTDYKRAVLSEPGETTVFSWVEWPSKAARVAGREKIMAEERSKNNPNNQPFDGKRMIYDESRTHYTREIPHFSRGRASDRPANHRNTHP